MKVVWFPAWACQNYTYGQSYGRRCPYCPYSLDRDTNRLMYDNRATASDARASADDLVGFFNANFVNMNGSLEISGGEALMRGDLPEILARIRHRWAITSNTLMGVLIDRMIENGVLRRCGGWTASWHPCSGMEESYARNINRLAGAGVRPRATVVVSRHTIDRLADAVSFLRGLPLSGINWHLDAHGQPGGGEELRARADAVLGSGVVYLAGEPPRGAMCNRHDRLMAVGADGTLYECVTFAYQDKFPVCKVDASVRLDRLPRRVEWCDEVCFACCDHVKHE
jgi:MoaA/NifB/PqqE/SkfB family radical SAM enzyme